MSWKATNKSMEEAVQDGEFHVVLATSTGSITSTAGVKVTTPDPLFGTASSTSSTDAIALSVTPAALFRLLKIEAAYSAAPTTSESLTVKCNAGDGTLYDTTIISDNPSVSSATSYIETLGKGFEYEADDVIDIAYANTDNGDVNVRLSYELI